MSMYCEKPIHIENRKSENKVHENDTAGTNLTRSKVRQMCNLPINNNNNHRHHQQHQNYMTFHDQFT